MFAKLYWIELAVYVVLAWLLIGRFGIIGAAIAWSLRVFLDAFVIIALSKRIAGAKFAFFAHFGVLLAAIGVLILPILLYASGLYFPIVLAAGVIALGLYSILVWNRFVDADEKAWIKALVGSMLARSRS